MEDNLAREAREEQAKLARLAEYDRRTIERYGLMSPPPMPPLP